ncbi:MAG: hypothetical protein AAF939_20820, partial [Planctomycetota bacterium]
MRSIFIFGLFFCCSIGATFGQQADRALNRQRLFDRFDKDRDGVLSASERQALRAFVTNRSKQSTDRDATAKKEGLEKLYKTSDGPYAVEFVKKHVLRDKKRDKDLQLRITFPKEGEQFPLIVWSHGASGTKDNYQPIVRHWVSHGYVVIAANHSDSRALRPIDPTKRLGEATFRDWENRPEDVRFILDSIASLQRDIPKLDNKINRSVIGVGGHSFGAHTAQLVGGTQTKGFTGERKSHADKRPKAFLLISPQGRGPQLDEKSWAELHRPALVVTGSNDGGRNGQDHTWRLDPFEFSPPKDKHLLFIEDAYHGFGGITGISGMGNSGPENPNHVAYVQSTTTAFWDAYLKNDSAAKLALAKSKIKTLSDGEASIRRRESETPKRSTSKKEFDQGTSLDKRPVGKLKTKTRDLVWTDRQRDRDIPIRVYSPVSPG